MRFDGKVALITAAAAGIGRATAGIIAAEGGTVVAVDTDEGRLDAAVAAIKAAGGRAHARRADALDPKQVEAVVEQTVRELGRIDILLNAVGGSTIIPRPAATVDELTLDDWQRLIAFNLEGTFLGCRTVVPVMKRQRSGNVVNIASIAGRGISRPDRRCEHHPRPDEHPDRPHGKPPNPFDCLHSGEVSRHRYNAACQ